MKVHVRNTIYRYLFNFWLSLKISRRTSRRGCTREFPHQVHCSRLNITRRLTKLLLVGHLLSGWPTLRPIFPRHLRKTIQEIQDASIRFNRIIIAHRWVIVKCLAMFNALVRVWTRVLKVGDVMRVCLTKSLKFLLGIILFGLRSFVRPE